MLWRASQLLLSSEIRASEVGLPGREVDDRAQRQDAGRCPLLAYTSHNRAQTHSSSGGSPLLGPVAPLPKHKSPSSGGVAGRAAAFTNKKITIQATSNTSGGPRRLWGSLRKNSLFFRAIFPQTPPGRTRFVNLLYTDVSPN